MPPEPTEVQKLAALETALASTMRKLDGAIADGHVARAASRMDSAGTKADDDAADARLAKLVGDAVAAAFKAHDDRRAKGDESDPDDGEEGGEPREAAADDDARADDDYEGEPTDMKPGRPAWAEPRNAPHGDLPEEPPRRGDSRADARRRQVDDDNDKLEAQQQFNEAFLATTGERAPQPVVGWSARTYRTYCLNRLKKFSPDYQGMDLTKLPPDALRLADRVIRSDALAVAHDPQAMQRFYGAQEGGMLREVRRTDRSGRIISEFVGPIDAPNGALAPFRMPRMRGQVDQDLAREGKLSRR